MKMQTFETSADDLIASRAPESLPGPQTKRMDVATAVRTAMQSLMTPTPAVIWIYCYELRPCIGCGVMLRSLRLVAPERGMCEMCWKSLTPCPLSR